MFSYHIGVIEEGKIQIQECSEFTQHTTGTQYTVSQNWENTLEAEIQEGS